MKTRTKRREARVMPYGDVNIAAFQAIKNQILAEPERFDVDSWFNWNEEKPSCGTTACIAGWACINEHLKTHKTIRTLRYLLDKSDTEHIAAKHLGISVEAANSIFRLHGWPVEFTEKYKAEQTTKGKARVAANFIDYICGRSTTLDNF